MSLTGSIILVTESTHIGANKLEYWDTTLKEKEDLISRSRFLQHRIVPRMLKNFGILFFLIIGISHSSFYITTQWNVYTKSSSSKTDFTNEAPAKNFPFNAA